MDYTKEQLEAAFKKLPDDVREAVTSVDTAQALNEIGASFGLHIDQEAELESEISLYLMGLTMPSDFAPHLEERLEITHKRAQEIAAEANDKIFLKVRQSILKIQQGHQDMGEKGGEIQISRDDILNQIENPTAQKIMAQPTPKPTYSDDMPAIAIARANRDSQRPPQTPSQPAQQTPPAQQKPVGSLLQQKLSTQVKMPTEEIFVTIPSKPADKPQSGLVPPKPPAAPAMPAAVPPPAPKSYPSADPYREPTN